MTLGLPPRLRLPISSTCSQPVSSASSSARSSLRRSATWRGARITTRKPSTVDRRRDARRWARGGDPETRGNGRTSGGGASKRPTGDRWPSATSRFPCRASRSVSWCVRFTTAQRQPRARGASTSWRRATRRSWRSRTAPSRSCSSARPAASPSTSSIPAGEYCYYYAHLERYADGLKEGDHVAQGRGHRLRRHFGQCP